MPISSPSRKFLLILFLSVLTISAFTIRLENFPRPNMRTFDEYIYYQLSLQMMRDPMNYTARSYGEYLQAQGEQPPDYFMDPLFKHPPLFCGLTAFLMRLAGGSPHTAGALAALLGALLIPLTYLLAARVFSRPAALLGTLFMAVDPINTICSQKIWMDTTLAFFMTLSLYLFVRGIQSQKTGWLTAGGLAGGLAALTKYPGFLVPMAVFMYALLFEQGLLRKKGFRSALACSLLPMIPWGLWNIKVYGPAFLKRQMALHELTSTLREPLAIAGVLGGLLLITGVYLWKRHQKTPADVLVSLSWEDSPLRFFPGVLTLCLTVLLSVPLLSSLRWDHIPVGTWIAADLPRANNLFYIAKLIEYSLIYALGFLSFSMPGVAAAPESRLLKISALLILAFFTAWGNFQSRYILPLTPLLIMLGAHVGIGWWTRLSSRPHTLVQRAGQTILVFLLVFVLLRTARIDMLFSFPHDFCYF